MGKQRPFYYLRTKQHALDHAVGGSLVSIRKLLVGRTEDSKTSRRNAQSHVSQVAHLDCAKTPQSKPLTQLQPLPEKHIRPGIARSISQWFPRRLLAAECPHRQTRK
jgi:hypothetical protein